VNPATSSQQVSWWSVHQFVVAHLQVKHWPMIGSPDWCEQDDDDPAKLAAVLDAAQHWALRIETCQQADADAGGEISAAADWSHIAQYIRDERDFYATHPWLKREVS
jgi:Protein of unknown function (DUF2742)